MNTLILTVGLPRSGKSRWAMRTGFPVVNPDSIRLALHGQAFLASAEPIVWATAHLMVAALFIAGHTTVILDATNLTEHRRNEWKSGDWDLSYKVFQTGKETCVARAREDGRDYLVPVIERMSKFIQWPPASQHWELEL